jgi:hypothetical protein
MEERRKEKRYLYQTLVKYEGDEDYRQFDAVSLNLSSEGISILSTVNVGVGEKFILKFLGREDPIATECEVIYNKPIENKFLIGCKIVKIYGVTRTELTKILEKTFDHIDI